MIHDHPRLRPRFSRRHWYIWLALAACPLLTGRAEETASPTPPAAEAEPTATVDPVAEQLKPLLTEFSKLFDARRFEEASEVLDKAEAIAPDHEVVVSARAGIYAESGKLDEARAIYKKLLEKSPDAFVPKYNLAELLLLDHQFDQGREAYEKLLKEFPNSDLIRYKILLTHLAQKNLKDALPWLDQLRQPTPTPFMLYGSAAIALYNADLLTGRRIILSAEQLFGPGRQKLLHDSLAEIGLVIRGDYPPALPSTPPAPDSTPEETDGTTQLTPLSTP
ncbi:MAG TPA: tetratricopeptide repeat protein [Chthoniobacteraceae bacterium]|nr:tetratricopeptide repeat protein [Chthoniobacteraceae bacterium]